MPQEGASEQEVDDPDVEAFVEVDPSGRYGRYKEVLGKGAFKKVYRAFDEWEGIEVAWNQVKVAEIVRNSEDLERLYSEVHLLKTLKHKNIIKFYNSWVDTKNEHINFITEIFTSGTLRQYRKKHKHVDLRALKKWSRQILEGLVYLHSHDPPIIHRDLKCDNIFVNGNHGEVKIGDLGFAAILRHANAAHSVIGTPEFMAPELYEEEYNELVDIYAFGMCVLELVTFEYPYIECSNAAQIYKKVTSGVKPASLVKVKDPSVKTFIEKCIADVSERLSANELLNDPFLISDEDNECFGRSLSIKTVSSVAGVVDQPEQSRWVLHHGDPEPSRDYMVEGERKDVNTIFIKLRIADSAGNFRNIHFPYDIEADTSIAVASEMVHELDLTDQDVTIIADRIDSEIRSHIPDWSPRESFVDESAFDSHTSDVKDDSSPLANSSVPSGGSLILEQMPSGRKFWLESPRVVGGHALSPVKPSPSSSFHSQSSYHKDHTGEVSEQICGVENILDNASARGILDDGVVNENEVLNPGGFVLELNKTLSNEASSHQLLTIKTSDDKVSCDSQDVALECSQSGELDEKHLQLIAFSGTDTSDENDVVLGCIESEEVRIVANKLERLLQQQQRELDEVRLKHELEVSNLLKQLPHKVRCKVYKLCRYKVPDYRMHCESHLYAENVARSDSFLFSSQTSTADVKSISPDNISSAVVDAHLSNTKTATDTPTASRTIHLSNVKNPATGAEGFVVGPVLRERLSNMKRGSKPDLGIAVILKDDLEKP